MGVLNKRLSVEFTASLNKDNVRERAFIDLVELVVLDFPDYPDQEELKGEALLKLTRKVSLIKKAENPFNYAWQLAKNTMLRRMSIGVKLTQASELDPNFVAEPPPPFQEIPQQLEEEVKQFLRSSLNELRVFQIKETK